MYIMSPGPGYARLTMVFTRKCIYIYIYIYLYTYICNTYNVYICNIYNVCIYIIYIFIYYKYLYVLPEHK